MANLIISAQKVVMNEDDGRGTITSDLGGRTRYGITSKYNPDVDLDTLTPDGAAQIYATRYGSSYGLDRIADQDIADYVMDCLVNPGTGDGSKVVQDAINRVSPGLVTIDGVMGPATINAINRLESRALLECLRASRAVYYFKNVLKDNSKTVWLYGWVRRAVR